MDSINTILVHSGCTERALSSFDETYHPANKTIIHFLADRVPEFRELQAVRQQGWSNPRGDQYFQQQRDRADKANSRTARFFFDMMQRIGYELHNAVGAFEIPNDTLSPPMVLDMCMAPGGFLKTGLELNPSARALGFSLPVNSGGHKALIPKSQRIELRFLDITMLAADIGVESIPVEHPEYDQFSPQQLTPDNQFDLVICDGQVLRTHSGESYREKREARRLAVTQLSLGLEHAKPGSTMILFLHKLETWDTVLLLYTFRKFATISLFKPRTSHAKRSSFYMVARNIQSNHPAAACAIKKWKSIWKAATLESDEEYEKAVREDEPIVEEVLDEFGAELIALAKDVWITQARALATAPFIRQ